jgi:methionine sulfoxide reductase heme-binding subunit
MSANAGTARATGTGTLVPYAIAIGVLLLIAGADLVRFGLTVDGAAALTRHTARLAFLFFFITFTASVWITWRVTPLTAWLMRRRRHLGLSFALVHFVHLGALSTLFALLGQRPDTFTLVFGGLAYVLLASMALTSNRASRRTLGWGWRLLHLTGCWYLWLIFTRSYLNRLDPHAEAEPYGVFLLLAALALAVPLLRTWAWFRRRTRRADAGAIPA